MHNSATSDLNAVIGRQAFAGSRGHACRRDGKHGNPKRVPVFFLHSASKIKINAIPSMPAQVAASTSSRHRDRERKKRERGRGGSNAFPSRHLVRFFSSRNEGDSRSQICRSRLRHALPACRFPFHLPLPENSQWRHVRASQSRSLCFANFRRSSVHEKPSSVREFARRRLFLGPFSFFFFFLFSF